MIDILIDCLVYDDSGNFLIYSSLLGIKFVNLKTQRVSRLLGQREHLRPLAIALFQVGSTLASYSTLPCGEQLRPLAIALFQVESNSGH